MKKELTLLMLIISWLNCKIDLRKSVAKIVFKSLEPELNKKYPKMTALTKMSLLIFDKLNEYRESLELKKLIWNSDVYILTLEHSYYQAAKKDINHDNFSIRTQDFKSKNENVAFFSTLEISPEDGAAKFFEMWKNSDGHDANMKSNTINSGAVAVIKNENQYYSTMINVYV